MPLNIVSENIYSKDSRIFIETMTNLHINMVRYNNRVINLQAEKIAFDSIKQHFKLISNRQIDSSAVKEFYKAINQYVFGKYEICAIAYPSLEIVNAKYEFMGVIKWDGKISSSSYSEDKVPALSLYLDIRDINNKRLLYNRAGVELLVETAVQANTPIVNIYSNPGKDKYVKTEYIMTDKRSVEETMRLLFLPLSKKYLR
jgi:hypothetical protein